MTRMWKGPCEAVKAALADPIAIRLHRRAGEQMVFCKVADDGRSALVFRLQRGFQSILGIAQGRDPLDTIVNVALEFTEHDPELFGLIAALIERRTDEVTSDLAVLSKKLGHAIDDFTEAYQSLAQRYV